MSLAHLLSLTMVLNPLTLSRLRLDSIRVRRPSLLTSLHLFKRLHRFSILLLNEATKTLLHCILLMLTCPKRVRILLAAVGNPSALFISCFLPHPLRPATQVLNRDDTLVVVSMSHG